PLPRPAQPLARPARRVAWRFCRAGEPGRVGPPFGFLRKGNRWVKAFAEFFPFDFRLMKLKFCARVQCAPDRRHQTLLAGAKNRGFAYLAAIVTLLAKSDHLEFHITNAGTCGQIAGVLDLCLLQIERTNLAAPQKLCAKR